jgi:23S rRNA (cytidine1920-2'-O)/16S rRNA (cytidine1409-2'-O)-methyltransferase
MRPERRAGGISLANVTYSKLRAASGSLCEASHSDPGGYAPVVPKRRLDTLLAERGLFESRTRAAAAVLAGEVHLGRDGRPAEKPGELVPDDVPVAVAEAPDFVSRGGVKLANALDALGLDVEGRRCLDVGAATGGFTDCLLQRGAATVTALDVAYGELHWRLRQDPRVTVIERRNARELEAAELPYRPDLVVADVSFISLVKVLPAALAAAAPRFDCLALVKPQFELGRGRVGKGGVVRSADDRREALVTVGAFAREQLGLSVLGYASSGLPGPAGNRESFVWIAEAGRPGAVADLERVARRAEP